MQHARDNTKELTRNAVYSMMLSQLQLQWSQQSIFISGVTRFWTMCEYFKKHSKPTSIEIEQLKKYNEECLALVVYALEKIDWTKYRR